MALSTATITYDLSDLGGVDFDTRRTKVWADTNLADDTVIDTVGNQIRLGNMRGTLATDGTGSIVVWVPGTGSNPTTWQTYIHVDYPLTVGGRTTRVFGPFTVTVDANLADLVEEQEVPPAYLTTVTTLLDGYVTDAAASAAAALVSELGAAGSAATAAEIAIGSAAAALAARSHYVDTDYASLEAALTALPNYATLQIRGVWTRTSTFTVNKPCTIQFAVGGQIDVTAANVDAITVTADYVTIVDPNLRGNTSGTLGTGDGISVTGTAGTPINQLAVIGTGTKWASIQRFSRYGVNLDNVTNFTVQGVTITNIAYAGVSVLAGLVGRIHRNNISTITQPSGSFSYGIIMSRDSTVALAVSPRSYRILCTENVVDGVTGWEGIDTHGGEEITIALNRVSNTKIGINVSNSVNESSVATYAPINCTVEGNICNSGVTDGSRREGIVFGGAGSSTSVTEYATGIVRGNTIIGYGDDSTGNSGGYFFQLTRGLNVSGNRAVACSRNAYFAYYQNAGMTFMGNTAVDVFTTAGATAAFLYVAGEHNTITVGGCILSRGTKSATHINDRAYTVQNSVGNVITEGSNDFLLATAYTGGSGAVDSVFRFSQRGVRSGYVAASPTRGVWERGAQVLSNVAAASTSPGWVCTTAGGASSATWAATTAYTAGSYIKTAAGKVMECVVAGTSGGAEPTLTTINEWVTDGTVTWAYRSATSAVFKTMAALGA